MEKKQLLKNAFLTYNDKKEKSSLYSKYKEFKKFNISFGVQDVSEKNNIILLSNNLTDPVFDILCFFSFQV